MRLPTRPSGSMPCAQEPLSHCARSVRQCSITSATHGPMEAHDIDASQHTSNTRTCRSRGRGRGRAHLTTQVTPPHPSCEEKTFRKKNGKIEKQINADAG